MNTSRLHYAYHLDRDYFIPFIEIYQPFYGFAIIPIHFVAFYLLSEHTKNWVTTIRACYFLNQAIMCAHDVWTCFFFRGYHLLPNPIAICGGLACAWIGQYNALVSNNNRASLHGPLSRSTFFSLLMMHQQVAKLNSSYVLPNWIKISASVVIYIGLWANGIVSILTSGDVPRAQEIIERQQLIWLRDYKHYYLMIFGEVGNCGPYRYEIYVIVATIMVSIPIRVLLVGSSVRLLRQHSVLTSRAIRMRKLYISVLLRQTTIISVFYVYPLLLSIVAFRFQIAFLPDWLLAFTRIGAVMSYMFQSVPQFYVLISANKSFRDVLASNIGCWKRNRTSPIKFSMTLG